MAEMDGFELQLRAAVRRYADDVGSDVDVLELAARVTRRTRRGGPVLPEIGWLRRPASVSGYLAWALLLLALLGATIGVAALLQQPRLLGLGVPGKIAFDTNGHVIITDANGANQVDLSPEGHDYLPSWSADGTRLAFWRETGPVFSIVITDPNGHTIRTIATQHPSGDPMGSGYAGGAGGPLQWSPDGQRIACWIGVPVGDILMPRIAIIPLDGSPPYVVGDPAIPAADPMWSPDGRQIVFAGLAGFFPIPEVNASGNGVYVMNADGSNLHRVSHERYADIAPDAVSYREPQWQPGGSLIAYAASPNGGVYHVYTVHADGTGTRDVTAATGTALDEDQAPRWSADGRQLAMIRWVSSIGGYHPTITGVDAATARTFGEVWVDPIAPTWAPDAQSILVYERNPQDSVEPTVLKVDLATGAAHPIRIPFDNPGGWQRAP